MVTEVTAYALLETSARHIEFPALNGNSRASLKLLVSENGTQETPRAVENTYLLLLSHWQFNSISQSRNDLGLIEHQAVLSLFDSVIETSSSTELFDSLSICHIPTDPQGLPYDCLHPGRHGQDQATCGISSPAIGQ